MIIKLWQCTVGHLKWVRVNIGQTHRSVKCEVFNETIFFFSSLVDCTATQNNIRVHFVVHLNSVLLQCIIRNHFYSSVVECTATKEQQKERLSGLPYAGVLTDKLFEYITDSCSRSSILLPCLNTYMITYMKLKLLQAVPQRCTVSFRPH